LPRSLMARKNLPPSNSVNQGWTLLQGCLTTSVYPTTVQDKKYKPLKDKV
jgi:hypothetical protein